MLNVRKNFCPSLTKLDRKKQILFIVIDQAFSHSLNFFFGNFFNGLWLGEVRRVLRTFRTCTDFSLSLDPSGNPIQATGSAIQPIKYI